MPTMPVVDEIGAAHAVAVDEILARLDTSPAHGLDPGEAAARLARIGPNELDEDPPVPWWRRAIAQFTDPLVVLLLVAVAISMVAWVAEGTEGTPFDAIVIAAILLLNAVIGVVQETRARDAVEALREMTLLEATARRAGEDRRIPARDLVVGDVVVLGEGDAVPADVRLVGLAGLVVAEAALTGESEAVDKGVDPVEVDAALADRRSMAYLGTEVTRGNATAVVVATGMDTELGHIAGMLKDQPDEPTPLQQEVARLGRFLGVVVVVIAVVVMAAIFVTSDIEGASDVVDVALVGVSLAVAAVPEGLPAVLTVVLALGVRRLAGRGAIVKALASVETLGSASVICSDKTGTLTRNEMTVRRLVTASVDAELTGTGYGPQGKAVDHADGQRISDRIGLEELRALLASGSLANEASLYHDPEAGWRVIGDPTEGAFLAARRKVGLRPDDIEARFTRVGTVPFDSTRKLMSSVELDEARPGTATIFTKGAPDVLLERCVDERVGISARPLTDSRRAEILATVELLADDAYRVLAVAYRRLEGGAPHPDAVEPLDEPIDESIERDLTWVGVVGVFDPPRREAKSAIAEAHGAGIRTIMITGDHPRTAVRIAAELGLSERAGVMTGAEIEELDAATLVERVRDIDVYARVTPEHKLRLVKALRVDGHIVAMTGDGVNDAPALRSADIGVAMGITGTDVSKGAADMILVDDDFATIVAAVQEGRAVFSNIRKFLRYLLSSNVGEVFTMFFGVVLAGLIGLDAAAAGELAVPLLVTQILWINLLTDALPALALGVDTPATDLMNRKPRRLTDRLIDTEMIRGIALIGLVMAAAALFALDIQLEGGLIEGDETLAYARTAAFTTLVLAQVFNAFNSRSDTTSAFSGLFTNRFLWLAGAVSVALQLLVVHAPPLNDAFDTEPLSVTTWLVCTGLASTVLWVDELRKAVNGRSRPRRSTAA
jgi:magnesium-transporting ATPase (P-type)